MVKKEVNMKQILTAEVKCQKKDTCGKVEVSRTELKKFGNKRVILKIFLK
jgi:hypothetical protein